MATYVLIHGAYQGGWIWKFVSEHLRAAGHTVYAPSLDGCAERSHLARPGITVASQGDEVAQLLFQEDLREVVLVGTSNGGNVVCRVAELARERVARLVFVNALAFLPGETTLTLKPPNPRPLIRTDITILAKPEGLNALFGELDPTLRAWAVERARPHPVEAVEGVAMQSSSTFWQQQWVATVIAGTKGSSAPVSLMRRTQEALKADWWEIDSGHFPMLSQPKELARLLQIEPKR